MGKYLLLAVGCMLSAWAWAAPGKNLIGRWDCQGNEGATLLEFRNAGSLIYDGEENSYRIQGNAILIPGLSGEDAYRFKLQGQKLTVTFPEGEIIRCQRAVRRAPSGDNQTAAGGGNAHLRGRFCQWSGSSSSYSGTSYSRTAAILFDGQGNAMYGGSESSFSSNEGLTYGSGGGGARGVYQVRGKEVRIRMEDGSQVVATINMRQNDGRITELMVNGKLWATGLCE